MDFVKELEWRGMIHDIMPGTQEKLNESMKAGYIGFDPTADSLHVGSLVPIMILKHFQKAGHQPFVLVGGATGMVGDPSGKSQERNLLDADTLDKNVAGLKNQLSQFLDFSNGDNKAVMVNNYDWFKDFFDNTILPRFPGEETCRFTKVKWNKEMLEIAIKDLGVKLNESINEMMLFDPNPQMCKFFKLTYVNPKRWGAMIREKQIQELLEKGLL